MNKLSILLACFILIGSLFAGDLVITKGGFGELTSNKLANYSYATKDKLGATIIEDTVLNRIDAKTNTLLDCGLYTCDYKIRVNAKQALQFDTDSIVGKGATVESVSFTDIRLVEKSRPKYGTETKEECTVNNQTLKLECKNVTNTVQTGTETYFENETFENMAAPKFKINESRIITIRFSRKSMYEPVDIYHTIFGQERKDAAWWNATWTYAISIDINTTVQSNLTNFPARVSMNTSNSMLWNTTTCTNVRFIASDNTTVLNYDLDSNSPVFCGNATNNATFWVSVNTTNSSAGLTRIYAYLGNTGAPSGENEQAVWLAAFYAGVWHGETVGSTLVDSVNRNNMTANATSCFSQAAGAKIGLAINFSNNPQCYYSKSNPVSLPAGDASLTVSEYVYEVAGGSGYTICWGTGSTSLAKLCLFYNNGGKLSVVSSSTTYSSTFGVFDNSWTHVGVNRTASGGSFWGVYANTTKENIASGGTPNIGTGTLSLGVPYWATAGNGYAGLLDEVRIRNVSSTNDWLLAEYGQTASVGANETNTNGSSGPITITISLTSPTNATYLGASNVSHIFSVNQSNSSNVTVKFYLDGGLNQTLTQTANTTYNLSKIMTEGLHSWYVFAYQTSNTSNNITSSNYTYTVDTIAPQNLSLNLVNGYYYYLNRTINLTFSEGSFKNCTISINGTQFNMVNISASVCQYNLTGLGNYSIYGTVNDLSGLSSNSSVVNISIFNYSFVTGFENPQYDMLTSPANITFTLNNYWGDISANLTYNGTLYTGTSNGNVISATVTPPIVSNTRTQNLSWSFAFINSSQASSTSNTTTLYPSGLQPCGGLTNTTAINYSVIDSQTSSKINTTATITFSQTTASASKTLIYSNTSLNHQICIFPSYMTLNATIAESFSNPSYSPLTVDRTVTQYSNITRNYIISMINQTSTKITVITGITAINVPLSDYYVLVEQWNQITSAYANITFSKLNTNGQVSLFLIPNTVLYRMSIYSPNATLVQQFDAQVITCDPFSGYCSVTLQIPLTYYMPAISEIDVGNGAISYTNNSTTYTYPTATCTFYNTTGVLICSNTLPASNTVYLRVIEISQNITTERCLLSGTGGTTLTCSSLNLTGKKCFPFILSTQINGSLNHLTDQILVYGQPCVNQPPRTNLGAGGIIMAFLLIGSLAMIGLYFGVFGISAGLAVGLVVSQLLSLIALSFSAVLFFALVLVVIGFYMRNRD